MAVPAPKIIVIITEDLNLQKISHTAWETSVRLFLINTIVKFLTPIFESVHPAGIYQSLIFKYSICNTCRNLHSVLTIYVVSLYLIISVNKIIYCLNALMRIIAICRSVFAIIYHPINSCCCNMKSGVT